MCSFVNILVKTWENVQVRMIDSASLRFGQVYRVSHMISKSTLVVNLGGAGPFTRQDFNSRFQAFVVLPSPATRLTLAHAANVS